MKIKYPIRYKFLSVTTLLLVFSVVAYLFLASHIFKRDKIELVFDLNRGAVSSLAGDISTLFSGIGDKMKLVAVLSQDAASKSVVTDLLHNDANIVFMAASYGFKNLDHTFYTDAEFATTYGVEEAYFLETLVAETARPVPFAEIQVSGEAVWNATVKDGPPLIGFGKSVVPETDEAAASDASGPAPFAIVAFIRADKMLKSFTNSRLSEVFAVNRHGQVLVHPVPERMADAIGMSENPLFKLAVSQPVKTGVSSFNLNGANILGAYASAQDGRIIVLSQVNGSVAFSAVERLVSRSLVFALIAITAAFLVAVLFSRSLTRPIQALALAMERVSDGELTTTIELKTNDEISLLADSFNAMLGDLRVSRESLVEANRDLEGKVKDRTRKLEEQNLAVKRAQEALLQSTRLAAVGEVAGRAAHEVLNPLTSIVTRLEKVRSRLERGPVQEISLVGDIVAGWEQDVSQGGLPKLVENWQAPSALDQSVSLWQEDIDNVKHAQTAVRGEVSELLTDTDFLLKESQRINKIVQNMRSLSRVKNELRVLSAASLMRDALNIMADLCAHHQIRIEEVFPDASDDHVEVDSDEFIQCATNLLRNSIQAILARKTNDGLIRVSIETTTDGVCIDIADNGVGIRDEDAGKLFEIQFSTKPPEEGTGLGLSISRRFIRAFGGDIRLLRSAPNEGCVFRITLPHVLIQEEQRVAV